MKRDYGLIVLNAVTTALLGLYYHFKTLNVFLPIPLFLIGTNIFLSYLTYYSNKRVIRITYILGKSQIDTLLSLFWMMLISHLLGLLFLEALFLYIRAFDMTIFLISLLVLIWMIAIKELLFALFWEKLL